jgi:hypothetical protein
MTDILTATEIARALGRSLSATKTQAASKVMATMTTYGPEEYFIKALSANFEALTGTELNIQLGPDYSDPLDLVLTVMNGDLFYRTTIDKEQLMADTASTTNATLNELVDWFMTEHKKEEWKKELLPETKEESVEVADMYL